MSHTICVDLDGVLASYTGWQGVEVIGDPIPGAQEFISNLQRYGEVVVHTARAGSGPDGTQDYLVGVRVVTAWLRRHKFPRVRVWKERGKPTATVYIDDRAVPCCPQAEPSPEKAYEKALGQARDLLRGGTSG